MVEAACVYVCHTYVGSEWISSNPMQRGGAPAYSGQSRFWRRRAYICALPMSGWISSDPMRRGGASAYGGWSRWWRRCAYMCASYLCWFQVDLIGFNVERRHSSLRWLEPMVEATCVYVQPTYAGSEWTSSDPMRRGGTPAYGDRSRWWGSVLTCAPLPMSVRVDLIGSDVERRCSSLRRSEPMVEATCIHVCPTYVGSGWISSDLMRGGCAPAYGGRSGGGGVHTFAPYLCRF
jgi:hypothetical protein